MSYIDKATVGGTTYDLHDSSLDANIASNANIWVKKQVSSVWRLTEPSKGRLRLTN